MLQLFVLRCFKVQDVGVVSGGLRLFNNAACDALLLICYKIAPLVETITTTKQEGYLLDVKTKTDQTLSRCIGVGLVLMVLKKSGIYAHVMLI